MTGIRNIGKLKDHRCLLSSWTHETWGRGITLIIEGCKAAELPEPTFEVAEPFVNLTIRFKAPLSKSGGLNGTVNGTVNLSDKEEMTLDIIRQHPDFTLTQIGVEMGKSRRMAARYVASLKAKGIIRQEGSDKSGHWVITK